MPLGTSGTEELVVEPTLQEWNTLVYNRLGAAAANLGDLGPGEFEPDRLDFGALPGNIDQMDPVGPIDVLRLRQYFAGNCPACPNCGDLALCFDVDRNGLLLEPIDFLRMRQIIYGTGPVAMPWAGKRMNHDQP